MVRNLLASTAIATLVATGAYAQTTEPAAEPTMEMEQQQQIERAPGHLASNIIGERVYNSAADDAENIGNVKDIVLGVDGQTEYVVIGVGGFLGLGQHEVAIPYQELEWTERDGQWWLVVNTTRDALEAQPEFDSAAYDPALGLPPAPADDDVAEAPADEELVEEDAAEAPADEEVIEDDVAEAPADEEVIEDDVAEAPADEEVIEDDVAEAPADEEVIEDDVAEAPTDDELVEEDVAEAPADEEVIEDDVAEAPADEEVIEDDVAEAPADEEVIEDDVAEAPADEVDQLETGAVDPGTLDTAATAVLSVDRLIGTTVYGANDENVGSVGDVILTQDGDADAIIIDVGGFLGIGTKEVAVAMDHLEFMTDAQGNMYLYTQFTEEQLEAQPEYDPATYAEQRDEQRFIFQ